MYWHEGEERKKNDHPMCTEFPTQHVGLEDELKAFRYLTARNLSVTLARKNGWFLSSDAGDSYLRIVIPATTYKAGHVYWQARDITGKAFIRYQSPKGPRHEALVCVHPFNVPVGVVVVEGPMDALAVARAGYLGIALMGMQPSQPTLYHLALIIEDYKELFTLVVLDRDSGHHAIRISTFLCSQGYHANIKVLPGPEKDLAECLPSKRRKFLSQSFQNSSLSKS